MTPKIKPQQYVVVREHRHDGFAIVPEWAQRLDCAVALRPTQDEARALCALLNQQSRSSFQARYA